MPPYTQFFFSSILVTSYGNSNLHEFNRGETQHIPGYTNYFWFPSISRAFNKKTSRFKNTSLHNQCKFSFNICIGINWIFKIIHQFYLSTNVCVNIFLIANQIYLRASCRLLSCFIKHYMVFCYSTVSIKTVYEHQQLIYLMLDCTYIFLFFIIKKNFKNINILKYHHVSYNFYNFTITFWKTDKKRVFF